MGEHAVTASVGETEKSPAAGLRRQLSRAELLRYSLLAAAGVLPYLNTLWNGFVYDDQYQVVQNPFLRSFHFLGTIFTTSAWAFQVRHGTVTYYRPLMSFAYLLIYQAFGPIPYAFHLLNLLLHCAVVLLFYLITRRVFGSEALAWISVALFALHPIHTEVVAWVADVPDLQMTVSLLLTFWFYLNLIEGAGHRNWNYAAAYGSYALALLSKEPAVMFPGVLLLYVLLRFSPGEKRALKKSLAYQLPVWLLAGFYAFARFFLLPGIIPNAYRANMTAREIGMSAVSLFGAYMGKLVWPANLAAFYPFQATSSAADPRFLAGAAWTCALGISLVWFWRVRRRAALAIVWLVLLLLPVLDAKAMASNVFAERYLYLPSIGFCWIVGELALPLWNRVVAPGRFALRAGLALAGASVCMLAARTVLARNVVWHDELRLYGTMVKQDPTNPTLHANLGGVYWNSNRKEEARAEWSMALAEDANNVFALDDLGISAASEKQYPEAIAYFQRAIAARPQFPKAHVHLAAALDSVRDSSAAEAEYQKALELSPFDVEARNAYAKFCLDRGRRKDAEEQYRLSLEVAASSDALDALGRAAMERNDLNAAAKLFAQASELNPIDSPAHFGLAEIHAKAGRIAAATLEYERGLETDPLNQAAQSALAKLRAAATLP